MRRYAVIRAAWDDEAKVWYVQESDIQGLATEAGTLEGLRERIRLIVADLLEGEADQPEEIEIDLIAYAHERVRVVA